MNIYQQIEQRHKSEAYDILNKLLRGEKVSRWNCFGRRHEINEIMSKTRSYESIRMDLGLIMDNARESL